MNVKSRVKTWLTIVCLFLAGHLMIFSVGTYCLAVEPSDVRSPVKMFDKFLGEPDTIELMRIDDAYWVPAHALTVDERGGCWLTKKQRLDQPGRQKIKVRRYVDKLTNRITFGVHIETSELNGWLWKMGLKKKSFIMLSKDYIPVGSISTGE